MTTEPQLHSSIVALVSLAAGIAAKHPDMGLCQLERLRDAGVPEAHIQAAIDIARHIRDEAAQKLDLSFDEKATIKKPIEIPCTTPEPTNSAEACCTPTASGQKCC